VEKTTVDGAGFHVSMDLDIGSWLDCVTDGVICLEIPNYGNLNLIANHSHVRDDVKICGPCAARDRGHQNSLWFDSFWARAMTHYGHGVLVLTQMAKYMMY
jgi:hypothetical protein